MLDWLSDNTHMRDYDLDKWWNLVPESNHVGRLVELCLNNNIVEALTASYVKVSPVFEERYLGDDEVLSLCDSRLNELEVLLAPIFSGGRSFMCKMNHSTKDVPYLQCKSAKQCIARLVCSERIYNDITQSNCSKLFLISWNDSVKNGKEYRVFIVDGKIVATACVPDEGNDGAEIDYSLMAPIANKYKQCAIDIVTIDDRTFVIEVNPLDDDTDLYGFSCSDIERLSQEER